MKIKIVKDKRRNKWVVWGPKGNQETGDAGATVCQTWELAMMQARWLMQHMENSKGSKLPLSCCAGTKEMVPGPYHACWCPHYIPRNEWKAADPTEVTMVMLS